MPPLLNYFIVYSSLSIHETLKNSHNILTKPGMMGGMSTMIAIHFKCNLIFHYRDAIIVYLERYDVLPTELDGFPVISEYSGIFEVIPSFFFLLFSLSFSRLVLIYFKIKTPSCTVFPNTFSLGQIKHILGAHQQRLRTSWCNSFRDWSCTQWPKSSLHHNICWNQGTYFR